MPHYSKDMRNKTKKTFRSTTVMLLYPGGKELRQQNQVPLTWSFLKGGDTHPIK